MEVRMQPRSEQHSNHYSTDGWKIILIEAIENSVSKTRWNNTYNLDVQELIPIFNTNKRQKSQPGIRRIPRFGEHLWNNKSLSDVAIGGEGIPVMPYLARPRLFGQAVS